MLVCGLFSLQTAFAADGTYISTSGGLWSDTANWSGGTVANGSGFGALFNTLNLTAPVTVNLDSAVTISKLNFADTNTATGGGWTLNDNGNAANTLTLGTAPAITVGSLSTGSAVTINTILAGTAGLTKNGPGQLILTRANTYTGTTTLSGGSTVLDFAAAGAPVSDIITATSPLSVAGSSTLTLTGAAGVANTQTFASTSFASGLANVNVNPGAGGTVALTLGAITGNTGALVRFGGTGSVAGTMADVSTLGVMGRFGASGTAVNSGFATFGLEEYAAINTGAVVAGSTVGGFYVTTTPSSSASVGNWSPTANATIGTGQRAATTTRFNSAAALTISLASGALFTNDAILVTPNVGANNTTFSGSGVWQIIRQTTPTGSQQGSVWQNNTLGFLSFNAPISNGRDTGDNNFVVKGGAGTLVLGGTNTYGGRLIINEGTVSVGADGNLGAANVGVTLDGGMLFGNTTFTAAAGRTVTLPTTGTLAAAAGTTLTIAGVVSGAGDLTIGSGTLVGTGAGTANATAILGSGTVEVTGTNTFAGAIKLNAGTLKAAALANLGNGTAITFDGGTLQQAGSYDISARSVTILSGGATIDTNGSSSTFANAIGNSGSGELTKNGTGTLTLSAANTYTGLTTVNAGGLIVNGSLAGAAIVNNTATLGGSGSVAGAVTVNTGGTLAPGASVGTLTVNELTLATGSILNYEFNTTPANDLIVVSASNGLTVNGGGFNLYQEGGISAFSTSGSYNLISYTGTLGGTGTTALSVLNPQPGKNYTFGSTATEVTLVIANVGVVSNWNVDAGGSWNTAGNWSSVIPNGSGETVNFSLALTAPVTVTLDGSKTAGAVNFDSAQGYTLAQGSGGTLFMDNGAGQANLIAASGSHSISAPVELTSTTVAAISGAASVTVSGVLSGSSPLTKSGTGTLDLTGTANTLSGLVTVAGGTLGFGSLGSLGTGNLTLDGGTLRYDTGNTADISSKVVTLGAGGGVIDTNGNDVVFAAAIGGAGSGPLTKTGAGALTLAAGSTYTGATTLSAGTLSLAANSALGDAATGAALTLQGGSTLDTSATLALNNGGVNHRAVTIGTGGTTFSPDTGTTLTVSGTVTGSAGITKVDTGTLTLSGSNAATLSSPILLDDGMLALGGGLANTQQALGTGAVTFQGGTLRLNGYNTADSGTTYGTLSNALVIPTGETGTLELPRRATITSTLTGAGTLNVVVDGIRDDFNGNWNAFTGQINLTSNPGGSGNDEFRITASSLNWASAKVHLGAGVLVQQTFNPPSSGALTTTHIIGELSGDAGSILGGQPVGGRFVEWQVGALNTNSTFAGILANETDVGNGLGEPRLNKVGTGTLTLTGESTFTGSTTVTAGILRVENAAGSGTGGGSVTVNAAGTLAGGGFISTADTKIITINGTLDVGAAGATLGSDFSITTGVGGSTILGTSSIVKFDLFTSFGSDQTGDSVAADVLILGGDLNIVSGAVLKLGNPNAVTFQHGDIFKILDWTALGVRSGSDWTLDAADLNLGSLTLDTSALYTLGNIAIVGVPEPSRALLLLLGLLGMLQRRRRSA